MAGPAGGGVRADRVQLPGGARLLPGRRLQGPVPRRRRGAAPGTAHHAARPAQGAARQHARTRLRRPRHRRGARYGRRRGRHRARAVDDGHLRPVRGDDADRIPPPARAPDGRGVPVRRGGPALQPRRTAAGPRHGRLGPAVRRPQPVGAGLPPAEPGASGRVRRRAGRLPAAGDLRTPAAGRPGASGHRGDRLSAGGGGGAADPRDAPAGRAADRGLAGAGPDRAGDGGPARQDPDLAGPAPATGQGERHAERKRRTGLGRRSRHRPPTGPGAAERHAGAGDAQTALP